MHAHRVSLKEGSAWLASSSLGWTLRRRGREEGGRGGGGMRRRRRRRRRRRKVEDVRAAHLGGTRCIDVM